MLKTRAAQETAMKAAAALLAALSIALAACLDGPAPSPGPDGGATETPAPTGTPSPTPGPSGSPPAPTPTTPPEDRGPPVTDWTPAWGEPGAAPLRPGSEARIGDVGCTFDWLFVDPANGTYFVGIAAHCTDRVGQNVSLVGEGVVGSVVYDSDDAEGADERVDFSLVRLAEGMNLLAHPRMLGNEGPTGFVGCGDGGAGAGDQIRLHGHGLVVGETPATQDRDGVLTFCDSGEYGAATAAIFGDSGGPVLHESGRALGIVSGIAVTVPPSELIGPTLPFIFQELGKAGFGGVALATVDGAFAGPA